MWNVPTKACEGLTHKDGINFFNKYAGQHNPATAIAAFCAFRKGLNAADSVAYPASKFGIVSQKNADRYVKITEVFKEFGAYQGDPDRATGEGMKNRQSKDYNDAGWDITEGNYARFIDQIKLKNGKGGMYFDVNDEFAKTCEKVEIRLVWLDKGLGKWTVSYNAEKKSNKSLLTVQNTNSGKWMEKTLLVTDARFANKGVRKSDIAITTKGKETTIFHLLEITKK